MAAPDTLNVSEFAKLVGMTQGGVSDHIRNGLPTDAEGRIDPDAGKAWLADNLDPAKRHPSATGRASVWPV